MVELDFAVNRSIHQLSTVLSVKFFVYCANYVFLSYFLLLFSHLQVEKYVKDFIRTWNKQLSFRHLLVWWHELLLPLIFKVLHNRKRFLNKIQQQLYSLIIHRFYVICLQRYFHRLLHSISQILFFLKLLFTRLRFCIRNFEVVVVS